MFEMYCICQTDFILNQRTFPDDLYICNSEVVAFDFPENHDVNVC